MNIENLIITINNEKQKDNIIMEKDIIRINARIKGGMNNMEANKTRKENKLLSNVATYVGFLDIKKKLQR